MAHELDFCYFELDFYCLDELDHHWPADKRVTRALIDVWVEALEWALAQCGHVLELPIHATIRAEIDRLRADICEHCTMVTNEQGNLKHSTDCPLERIAELERKLTACTLDRQVADIRIRLACDALKQAEITDYESLDVGVRKLDKVRLDLADEVMRLRRVIYTLAAHKFAVEARNEVRAEVERLRRAIAGVLPTLAESPGFTERSRALRHCYDTLRTAMEGEAGQ